MKELADIEAINQNSSGAKPFLMIRLLSIVRLPLRVLKISLLPMFLRLSSALFFFLFSFFFFFTFTLTFCKNNFETMKGPTLGFMYKRLSLSDLLSLYLLLFYPL